MASPKLKRPILTRRIPKIYSKAAKRYSVTVGTILWHWNRIHGALGDCFALIVTPNDMSLGLAVWHAILADSGQRAMLTAAIEKQTGSVPGNVSEALEWLNAVMAKLSGHRNDVAHTPMATTIDLVARDFAVIVDPVSAKPGSAARLSAPDLKKFHRLLIGDLTQLFFYAKHVLGELQTPTRLPWPQMPRLRCLPPHEVPLTRSQTSRRQKLQLLKQQRKALPGRRAGQNLSKRQQRDARIAEAKAKLAG